MIMKNVKVITIGREYSSGGADIGHMVADYFGIPCYNKTIIDKSAEELKFDRELVERYDERPHSIWRGVSGYQYGYSWYAGDPSLMQPINESIAEAQFAAIRRFAEEGPCVLVGRCADYVLRDRDDVFNVFVRADLEKRIERCMRRHDISASEAKKLIKQTDKVRSAYYESHTDRKWGAPGYADLILDSGRLGVDTAAQVIIAAVEKMQEYPRIEFK